MENEILTFGTNILNFNPLFKLFDKGIEYKSQFIAWESIN